ncbi:BnaC05g26780D [Brassica napus]|uniref:BnaC05g26780D protein n=1 Tax=Brassica napus TaxID=3708 RepID=A0A078F1P0_BRANA|nr:BnaC05g26780D [Brassica napus]
MLSVCRSVVVRCKLLVVVSF